jgi:3-dehydroquinate synthase
MKFYVDEKEFNGVLDFSDTINIKSLNKDYKVVYNNKNLDTLVNEIYKKDDFILIDRNVYNLSPSTFNNLLNNTLIFDAIEDNKNIENVLILIDILLDKKFTRNNKILVIGGGITQEIGGFASAIYKRGLNWVLIPTTILSMTDSCIGSKVSINRKSKNMLGLFVAPNEIYISDYFLDSLNNDDIISGLGEALKLSLIGGEETYSYFKKKLDEKDYINIIKMASLVKKEIIEYDEFENNERKVLNYGHTIGHALESTSNFFIPHGIAIMIGMYIKNELFYEGKYKEINNIILELVNKKFFEIDFNYNQFINHVLSDKKNKGDNIFLILLDEIGKSIFIYKKKEEIEYNLKIILKKIFINYND